MTPRLGWCGWWLGCLGLGCSDQLPAGLASAYDYQATLMGDEVVGAVTFGSSGSDSISGTFEDLRADPEDVAQFGNMFPVRGVVRGDRVSMRLEAPGVRIDHDGALMGARIDGTCTALIFDVADPVPCTFVMTER